MATNPYAENPQMIMQACKAAGGRREVSEEVARAICGQWHDGQTSAMYAFSSAGCYDRDGLLGELSDCFGDIRNIGHLDLDMLGTYILNRK